MTTFTAFKKRITEGMVIHSDNHMRPHISGERTVTKVQGNGIWYAFNDSDGLTKQGFTGWPPAKGVTINDDGSATFLDGKTNEPVFTYHISPCPRCGRAGHTHNTCDPVGTMEVPQ